MENQYGNNDTALDQWLSNNNADIKYPLGETFDYGPYGFMEDYLPSYVCNHSDHQGRYAFKNQPYIGLWNCSALGHALSSLISEESQDEILKTYESIFQNNNSSLNYLLNAENVILSPHIAGWTYESHKKLAKVILDKIKNL